MSAPAWKIGDAIFAQGSAGHVLLARVTTPGIATCAHPLAGGRQCGCPIQRASKGGLPEGVRAHYRTVHPEKGVQ